MKKDKMSYYVSPFLATGLTFNLLCGLFVLVLEFFIIPDMFAEEPMWVLIVVNFMCGILPITIWVSLIHRGLTKIEFNDKGISISLFKVFRRKEILWSEVKDIKEILRIENWIFISKHTLEGYSYMDMIADKDTIQIQDDCRIKMIIEKNLGYDFPNKTFKS